MRRHAHVGHDAVHRHGLEMLDVFARHDGHDAASAPRGLDVEPRDARVRVRRSQQDDVRAAGRGDVVHVAPGSREQPVVFASLERAADPCAVRRVCSLRHAVSSVRCRA